jgi:hypothetical protein
VARVPASLADLPSNAVRPLASLSVETLRTWAHAAQNHFVHVLLQGKRDRRLMLVEIGRALELPAWFGANLDALYDSLTDLPDRNAAPGFVIVLDGLQQGAQTDDTAALLDVFRDAADDFAGRGLAFRVFYR